MFFPLLIATKKNQGILEFLKKELEINIKYSLQTSLVYFIKNELKYYEYITHIVIDINAVDEKDKEFITALESLRMATSVPIIVYADELISGDILLSEIAQKNLANIVGSTPKKTKRTNLRLLQNDLREAIIKSSPQNAIGLRDERQKRFDINYNPPKTNAENIAEADIPPTYKDSDLHLSLSVAGVQSRVGTTTYAMQLCDYFALHHAKVAFVSRNDYTDSDLNILNETYNTRIENKGKYWTFRNIDFYKSGGTGIENPYDYNIIIFDYGFKIKDRFDEFFRAKIKYICCGGSECDILSAINVLKQDIYEGKEYRLVLNYFNTQLCTEQYHHLIRTVIGDNMVIPNKLVPQRFILPDELIQQFDKEFSAYRDTVKEGKDDKTCKETVKAK